ncbi:hypothetical protein EV368DRAFT_1303, partial [Lentinula lateritia]
YKEEQQCELADGERRKGAQKICEEVLNSHFAATEKCICLSYGTLINHTNGGKTISKFNQFNQSKRWLYPNKEEKFIVRYAVEMAEHGFPLSPRCLCEHANQILKHYLGSLAPENGLNANWAT